MIESINFYVFNNSMFKSCLARVTGWKCMNRTVLILSTNLMLSKVINSKVCNKSTISVIVVAMC